MPDKSGDNRLRQRAGATKWTANEKNRAGEQVLVRVREYPRGQRRGEAGVNGWRENERTRPRSHHHDRLCFPPSTSRILFRCI